MRGKRCKSIVTVLLLALAMRAESMPPSSTDSGHSTTAVSGARTCDLDVLGRWCGGPVYSSAVSGDHVFFGSGGAIRVLKIKNDASWHEVASIDTTGVVRGLFVSGPYAYVADDFQGMRVIDISAPCLPREVGHLDTPGEAMRITVSGSRAYVADGPSGLRVIDISNPSAPREIASYKTPSYAEDAWVSDGAAHVAAYDAGLVILALAPYANTSGAALSGR